MAKTKMSSVDTAWLRMDSTTNLMMIVGVMVFDTPLNVPRFKVLIEGRLLAYARFKQYVVDDGISAYWVDDETFDLDAHLHRVRLPGAGGEKELQAMVADLASERLDKGKPLWQMHLVENYQGGSALISRVHHCIADGIALIGVLLNMTDEDPNAADTPREVPKPKVKRFAEEKSRGFNPLSMLGPMGEQLQAQFAPMIAPAMQVVAPVLGIAQQAFDRLGPLKAPIESALDEGARIGNRVVNKYNRWVDDPALAMDSARVAAGFAKELAALAAMPSDTKTRLKGTTGTVKCVAWSEPISLALVKDVGYVLGCSVNDVLLASVAGAIRNYLVHKGDNVDGAQLRAFVPVNLRPPGKEYKLGNHFGLVGLELPIGEANPIARVFDVRSRMHALKTGYQAAVSMTLLGVVGYLPKAVQRQALGLLTEKGTAVMTNVPGPARPLYLAGSKIAQNMFWVPQSGNVGVGVSILSYAGGVQFGLITDRKLCPDPENIISGFATEFEKLTTSLMWVDSDHVGADARAFDDMFHATDVTAPAVKTVKKAIASKRKARA